GGATAAARNVIDANGELGVWISINSTSNQVLGNYIGVDPTGARALGNARGVRVDAGSANNTIGGTLTGAGNVISGSTGYGLEILDSNTTGTVVQGNYIGTNPAGTA